MCSVPELSDRPVVNTRAGAFKTTLETSNERIGALDLQVGLKDAGSVVRVAQVDGLEVCLQIAEEEASLMSATMCEHGLQLSAAEVARSNAEVALWSAESQLQVVSASES